MLALKYFRQKQGWSQADLAIVVGITQSRLSRIELGREKPNEALLHKLADVLEVAPAFTLLRPAELETRLVFKDVSA